MSGNMQFNPTQGQQSFSFPQQAPPTHHGSIQPPPTLPQRSRNSDVSLGYGTQGPPQLGWNIGRPASQPVMSPWGTQNVGTLSQNPNSPFNDNFVSVANLSPPQQNFIQNQQSSQINPNGIERQLSTGLSPLNSPHKAVVLSKDSVDIKPLITLSPENTLQRDYQIQNTTYSMDLEGLDFTSSHNGLDQEKKSSSTENIPVKSTNIYPDYSHLFSEVRQENCKPSVKNIASSFNNSYPAPNMNYGWNMSYLSDPSQNTYSHSCISSVTSNPAQQYPASKNYLQSTFRSNWTYQSPKLPTVFNAWGYTPITIPNTSLHVPPQQASLARCSSNSDFDDLRKSEDENLDVFDETLSSPRDFVEERPSRTRTTSDLIEFEEPEEKEYMSLDSFDPLYSRTRRESVLLRDTDSSTSSRSEVDPSFDVTQLDRPVSGLYPALESRVEENKDPPQENQSKEMTSADALENFFKSVLEETWPDSPAPPRPPRSRSSTEEGPYEKLRQRMFIDEDSNAFSQMVSKLKSKFRSTDTSVNRGFVVSAFCEKQQPALSVKVVIHSDYSVEPISFTCDIHSKVEHVISNVLYSHLQSEDSVSSDDFLLKVYDKSEYLLNDQPLSRYEYVNHCLKLDQDIMFMLLRRQEISLPFLRTIDDDEQQLVFPKDYVKTSEGIVSQNQLETLMNTFYKEMEALTDHILKMNIGKIKTQGLSQAVKALCTILANIQTNDVTKSLKRAEDIVQQMLENHHKQSCGSLLGGTQEAISSATHSSLVQEIQEVLEQLLKAVNQLVKMYCTAFHTDFTLGSPVKKDWSEKLSPHIEDDFILHLATAHRIPVDWGQRFDEYKVVCSLHHGGRKIGDDVVSQPTANKKDLCDWLNWDQWLSFKDVSICKLPRETRLCLTLCGMKGLPNSQNNDSSKMVMALGGVTMQLYNQKGYLIRGSQLVPLKMNTTADPYSPYCSTLQPDTVLLQINLPDFGQDILFPDVLPTCSSQRKSFSQLLPEIQDIVKGVLEKDCISSCQADQLEILWRYRHYLYEYSHLLPWILQGSQDWDCFHLSEISALLRDWPTLEPMQALELLLPQYPDTRVREFAVDCLHKISSDELVDFLPQLIQAMKYESYHASQLAWLLLEQSCKSIRFAHQFFWLLKGVAAQDTTYKRRYELMFVALVSVAGDPLYQEFRKQEEMVKILTTMAEKVQVSRDKDNTMKRESQILCEFFEERGNCLLPYDPGLCVSGVDLKSCSYFTSNAVPLKLVFKNPNIRADPVYVMFKAGDDLRQDMLTMQMIKIMDRLWLKSGLDLKIITFACLATGPKRGLIELITESETLRKIQVQAGVTGSFKDRPIKEWLQGHNPTELEYQKAVDNFTRSCAGYCVATYVLGVCDRHNDNIMLKQSGHMFHIDFNKFLGDSQMFGNIKRDRVPFVLTSDMAYVINNGEKQSDKFQDFIDLCCQAFNILRKNANLFLNLFALVSRSGIPGVSEGAARYIQKALLPGHTDAQASSIFTRMIEDSLKSVFTQFNFFIHNLAQLKFSSHQEGALLSFVPKTYSVNTDGRIQNVEVHSYQKRYQPDKHYIFILKVERENQKVPMYVFRHFSEYVEFRNKLVELFPLAGWPPPPSKFQMGRSHIKTVAETRKQEIERFLQALWQKATEIKESDVVYTFFHPLLRDEQEAQKERLNVAKLKAQNQVQLVWQPSQFGMVKLSVHHKRNTLHIMIMHAKDLPATSETPSPYVKMYLLPDPDKQTKRKTKIVKHSTHPTYNEVIEYKMSEDEMRQKTLQVSVWDHDVLKENNLIGAVYIKLRDLDVSMETANWYNLQKIQITDSNTVA